MDIVDVYLFILPTYNSSTFSSLALCKKNVCDSFYAHGIIFLFVLIF